MSTTTHLGPVEPFADFDGAASAVLQLLQENIGLALWVVTRQEDDDWIVLTARDQRYGIKGGDVLRWSDSFCSRMVQGLGPSIAPIVAEVEVYRNAPIAKQIEIGAYIGVPLRQADGKLFGTLCAIDPEPQGEELVEHLQGVVVYARLLSTILGAELAQQRSLREQEQVVVPSETDPQTGLLHSGGWETRLRLEESRCKRYGNPAGVVRLDLTENASISDSMGRAAVERLLRRAASVLRTTVRESDLVAHLGGGAFAILAPDEGALALEQLEARLLEELETAGVKAVVGSSRRDPRSDLASAQAQAEAAMSFRRKDQ